MDFGKDILVFLIWYKSFLMSHKNLSHIDILDKKVVYKTARLLACGQENYNSSSWKEKAPSVYNLPCNFFYERKFLQINSGWNVSWDERCCQSHAQDIQTVKKSVWKFVLGWKVLSTTCSSRSPGMHKFAFSRQVSRILIHHYMKSPIQTN